MSLREPRPAHRPASCDDTCGSPSRKFCFRAVVALLFLALGAGGAGAQDLGIGVAKAASVVGRTVTFEFFLENFAVDPLSDLSLVDSLDLAFGAGNYAILSGPTLLSAPGTIVVNPGYDGSGATELITSGTLAPGEVARIELVVEITAVTNQGMGPGVYSNQAVGTAVVGAEGASTDLSDFGTDPDPGGDGDPRGAGDDDPTIIDLLANPVIGAAKNATLAGQQVTLDFYLENFGNRTVGDLSLPDDFDAVFGVGNYTVVSPPTLIDDPGTLTLNAGFDGSGDPELIFSGTLIAGDRAQIRVVVQVDTVIDQGAGLGVYQNQVTFSGSTSSGAAFSDLSDAGTDPDTNGDGDPRDGDEDDPTIFVIGQQPVIGVAKNVVVNLSEVTFDVYLENLGNEDLDSVALADDLDAVFGTGNYTVSSGPALVVDPGTLLLDVSFDGSGATSLLLPGSSLAVGAIAQIRVVVAVTSLADLGLGFGNYENQVTVTAQGTGGGVTSDVSDFGTDPDPSGDGDPTGVDENDPTPFSVAEIPVLGIAKRVRVLPPTMATVDIGGVPGNNSGPRVVVTLSLENLGNVTVDTLSVVDNLDLVFGAGNYGTIFGTQFPEVTIAGAGSLTRNTSYNGSTQPVVISDGNLAPGSVAQIVFELLVVNVTDQGAGLGVYQNQATASGNGPGGGSTSDLSGPGNLADPDGNGDPTNGGEDDPTQFAVGSLIGAAKTATVAGTEVTFDLYLETFGGVDLGDVSLSDDLDAVFGVGNYFISSPPTWIDDPGTLTLNPGFDGGGDTDLLAPGGTLVAGDTAQIRFVVTVQVLITPAFNLGVYQNQVLAEATQPGGVVVLDLSDSGTDPDPNGNDDPTDFSESDPTPFTVTADAVVGVAKDVALSGSQVTFDFYLENLGTATSTDMTLTDDFDLAFGAGNHTLSSGPTLVVDPGTLVLNGGFDGSGDQNLLAAGSSLAAGATAQIQIVVDITTVTDLGSGLGVYSNQAAVTGTDSAGVVVTDLSDFGTDPDPNGDSDPTFPGLANPPVDGENDPTTFFLGGSGLGLALHSFVAGNLITYDYLFENLGDVSIGSISASQNLFSEFGFGNYVVSQQPILLEGDGSLTPISSFDGTFAQTLVSGGTLDPGERARIRLVLEITNQANGPDYTIQLTATGFDPLGNLLSDMSDDGIDPDADGDGNADEPGENDPTLSILGEETVLGVAKDASVIGSTVTFDVFLENFGNVTVSGLSLEEDLDAVFGTGNYTVTGAPMLIIDPGTLLLDPAWTGAGANELFLAGSTLGAGSFAQIQIEVEVTTVVDRGSGLGSYSNQVTVTGTGPSSTVAADVSDFGTDPDPNGSNNPADAGESDPTLFTLGYVAVGVAKAASVSGSLVTLDYVIENLGNTALSGYTLPDDLDAVFGAGKYQVVSGPIPIGSVRNLVPNPTFDGSSDTALLTGGTQEPGVFEQFRIVVRILEVTDQGSGPGIYTNQVTVTAEDGSGAMVSDLSDAGTDPDPNGNDDATEAGENDPTVITVAENPVVGVAKTASVVDRTVTIDLFLESLGNVPATALVLSEDLDAVFGAGSYTLVAPPALVVDPGTLTLDPGFGPGSADLLLAGSSLAQGAVAQIRFVVEVTTVSDQGFGFGNYQNQVRAAATGPFGAVAQDLSDAGTDPDPGGDGDPTGVGDDDPTPIALRGSIGDLVWNDLDGDGARDVGEPGIGGITVYLDLDAGGTRDPGEPFAVTSGGGAYGFGNLPADSYTVRVDAAGLPVGFVLTTGNDPQIVDLLSGERFADADFGFRAAAALTVTKGDTPDPVVAGETLTYALEVGNAGPSDAPEVTVFDVLPAGTVMQSNTGGCIENGDLLAFRALLEPGNEVPPVASAATGSATFVLDTTTLVLSYALHVADIDNITTAQIFAGAAGVNGPVTQFLYDGAPVFDPANAISGQIQLTSIEADELLTDPFYVNVLTSDFPGGEIRGQITALAGAPVSCDLGAIAAGASSAFEIIVDVASSVADGTVLGNVAIVFANATDPGGEDLPAPNGSGRLTGTTVLAETVVSTSADLSITKADSADPVAAGTTFSYTLEVSNAGPSDATSVVVSDTLPAGLTLVSTSGCAEDPTGVPTCTLGTLAAGLSTTITVAVTADSSLQGTITNTASVVSAITDPVAGNNSASEDTTLVAEADLSITKIDSIDPVLAGTTLTYTLEVSNSGPSDAASVVVTESLPAGVTVVSTTGCEEDPTGVPTCSLGTLIAGDSVSVTVVVDVDSDTLGVITNTASVASATTDPNGSNNSASEDTTVDAEADLSITKMDSVDPVLAGTSLTYTLEVTNSGPSNAATVVVTETLPAGVTLVSTTGCGEDPTGVPTCSLGSLAAGASTTVTVVVAVDSDTLGTITNTADVVSATTDPMGGNNSASEETTVSAEADLSLTKMDSIDPVVAGTGFTYTLQVTNNGPSDAASVVVTESLPAGLTFGSTTGCAEDPAGVPTCTLGSLAAGATASFTIAVTADSDTVGVLTNTAGVASATTDPNGSNNSASEDTTISAEADLSITKVDSQDPVPPDAPLSYTLEVSNDGPSDATGVVIIETLPAGVTLVATSGCAEDPAGVPTCTLGDLAVGASVTVTVDVTVDAATPSGQITNSVTVTSDAVDPDPSDDTASEDTLVDADAPTVDLVDSEASSGDGELEECEEVQAVVTRLLVTFSEPVMDPPGDVEPDDVTNPSNYLLVAAGPDRDLSTTVCGPTAGDDAQIMIDAVTYDNGTDTASLTLAGGQALDDEVYRLLACGSTSIRDIAGNPLDGDSDGTGGDDFVRTFRVERSNLLRNGHFDCTIDEWVAVSTVPEEIDSSTEDFDDSSVSGSAGFTNLSASQDFSLGQCVNVPGERMCSLDLRLRIDAAPEVVLTATRVCEAFSGPACTGISLQVDVSTSVVGDSGGTWSEQQLVTSTPVTAASMLCSLDLRSSVGADFDAFLDEVFLTCREEPLFADGFESGDTSAWTSTSP